MSHTPYPIPYTLKPSRGFTLLETVIYTGVFSIVVAAFMLIIINVISANERLTHNNRLTDDKQFVIQKFDWVLQNVSAINSPAANTSGATLSVNKLNFGNNPVVLDAPSGAMRIAYNAGSPILLTSGGISVSNLQFTHTSNANETRIRITGILANTLGATTSISYSKSIR